MTTATQIKPYSVYRPEEVFPVIAFIENPAEIHPMWSGEGNISYLVANAQTKETFLIDPDLEILGSYLLTFETQQLKLVAVIDTHNHAEHATASPTLKTLFNIPYIMHQQSPSTIVDERVNDCDTKKIAGLEVKFIHTPGHTPDLVSILIGKHVFTGDSLFIAGCGRADFPVSDAGTQFDSIHKLAQLPDDTVIHPGHDYNNQLSTTIGEAKIHNKRLQFKDKATFVEFMQTHYQGNEKPDDWEYYVHYNAK